MRWRRFLIIAAVVAAGGVAVLEFSARSAAVDMARTLEPLATLTYESAGISADGSVRLQDPRLVVNRGIWRGTVSARLAKLRGSGPFWLLGRFFSTDGGAPDNLHVETSGLRLGREDSDLPLAGWFGTSDLALFENIGCGSDALSDKDRIRMGVDTRERVDRFEYQYDEDSKELRLSGNLHSPDIADIGGFAEVSGFDGSHWQDPKAQTAARLTRAGVSYKDSGYLGRRNNFCAQWLGISASEFVSRHLDAVEVFLAARGIEPSREVRGLYQQLVTRGGNISVTSLPDASWVPVEIAAYPREDLLRQLNITARLEDAPPIMLRLVFSEPDTPLNLSAVGDGPASLALGGDDAGESGDLEAAVKIEATSEVSAAAAQSPDPEPPSSSANETASKAVADIPADAVDAPSMQSSPAQEVPAKKQEERRVIASSPPPPKDSTLALVWKPGVIERLPEQSARKQAYAVVPVERLQQMTGERVEIVTTSGKRVEGEVSEVTADHVVLQIQVGRGSAKLNVPLNRIREARVPESSAQRP
jgi:hypothetical protein